MASFESYNFDTDERWQAYLNSVEIIADPASAPAQIHRLKQKWFQKNIDPNFQFITEIPSASNTYRSPPTEVQQPVNAAYPAAVNAQSPLGRFTAGFILYLQEGDNKWHFAIFATFLWSLLHIVLYTVSFNTESILRYHSRALWSAMVGCILSIFAIVKPGGLTIENYMRQPIAHEFANYLAYCSIFLMAPPMLLELLPVAVLSVLSITTYILTVAPRVPMIVNSPANPLLERLNQSTPQLKLFSAYVEVANVPFMLLNIIFGRFSLILQCLMYWHFLSQRYIFSPHSRDVLDKVAAFADAKVLQPTSSPNLVSNYNSIRKYMRYFIDQHAAMRPHQQ